MITFNGRDLVARFKEDPNSTAIRQYRIEYLCAGSTVTHYVNAADHQGTDANGLRLYRDVLTFSENEAAGLTRTPRVTFYSQDADLKWSVGRLVEAQNPLPVLPAAPAITSTLTGFEVALKAPLDGDLEGYVVYVSKDATVPMSASTERYRGKSTAISIQLADDDQHYLRIAPFDAFGLNLNSAWAIQSVKRNDLNSAVGKTQAVIDVDKKADAANNAVFGLRDALPDLVTPMIRKPVDDVAALNLEYGASMSKATLALHDQNLVAIRNLETQVNTDGSKVAKELLQLTTRITDAEKDILGIDVVGPIDAGLSELRQTIANSNYSSAEAVDAKIATYGKGVTAWQTNEERVRSDNDKALTEDIRTMGVNVRSDLGKEITKLEGSFNDFREVAASKEDATALALSISDMGVRITNEVGGEKTAREAAIQAVQKTIVDTDKATAQKIETVSSSVGKITAADGPIARIDGTIETIQKTQATDNGARADETKALKSRLDNVNGASFEQSIKTYADKVDGVGASYVLKVQTDQNGQKYIAGMGVAIENGISALAFTGDSLRFMTPGGTPKQIFYADETGLYAPNLIVENLKAGSVDSPSLKQAAAQKTSFTYTNSQVHCPQGQTTTIAGYTFNKEDDDSLLRVMVFAQCYNSDDLRFNINVLFDGQSVQDARYNMVFDGGRSNSEAPVTTFCVLANKAAGDHTISVTLRHTAGEYATVVRPGAYIEVTELRRGSIANSSGSASPISTGGSGGSGGGGGGGDYGGGGGYDPNVNIA